MAQDVQKHDLKFAKKTQFCYGKNVLNMDKNYQKCQNKMVQNSSALPKIAQNGQDR